ncbi:hypothetical protein [Vagococcus fessus]|uniref:Uncharacterized protein n=1 Tax=Vagococcus fessus TaxID=120370 RepID=A0A430ABR4_9ENTE|nr:hypothetical protein [Vagococcus fessus]RSU04663.1 hypothetical protein CBF31_01195 [Vagococcus fessus]
MKINKQKSKEYLNMKHCQCSVKYYHVVKIKKLSKLSKESDFLEYYNSYKNFNNIHKEYYGVEKHVAIPKNFSENIVRNALSLKEYDGSDFDAKCGNQNYEIKCTSDNGKTTFSNKKPDVVLWLRVSSNHMRIYEKEFNKIDDKILKESNKRSNVDLSKLNMDLIAIILIQ